MTEHPKDPYIVSQARDWDVNHITQRAIPWAKRLRLLYRVSQLIKAFR